MKHEWKKSEKEVYLPKTTPAQIIIPEFKYIMISGKGDPNKPDFSEKVGVLYNMAYAIKMMPKQGFTPQGYFDYTVYPLEGIWDLSDEGKQLETLNKDELIYTIMIRQPDFVTREVFERAYSHLTAKRGSSPLLNEVSYGVLNDGLCVQMMHIGAFDEEQKSFDFMKEYCLENHLSRTDLRHREIYISDFRKTAPDKLKTVLRYFVKK